MLSTKYFIKRGKSREAAYFRAICRDSKKMYNCAVFYIGNVFTAFSKEEDKRYGKEDEAVAYVTEGINRHNEKMLTRFGLTVRCMGLALKNGAMPARKAYSFIHKVMPHCLPLPSKEKHMLSYAQLNAVFLEMEHPVYKRMPSQVNQNAIRKAVDAWGSFFKALKAYKKDPSSYTGRPNRPGYKKKDMDTAWFSNQVARMKDAGKKAVLSFVNSDAAVTVRKPAGEYVKTEVRPCYGGFEVIVTSDDEVKEVPVPDRPGKIMGVDTGLNNLAAVANNAGAVPFLIKGGAVKSINQWYNKRRAQLVSSMARGKDSSGHGCSSRALDALLRKRSYMLDDFFYKAAHFICRKASAYGIGLIIAGHNKRQKDSIEMGRENNQAFVSVPFERFLDILRLTAWKYGIAFLRREESYTSKASMLDSDYIPTYGVDDEKASFSGKRVKRGLYRSKDGIRINADVNGACNIIRKEYPDAFDGMDMSYLYKTTITIGFREIYANGEPEAVLAKRAAAKGHMHRPGPSSRSSHVYRSCRKMELLGVFKPEGTASSGTKEAA